MSLDRLHRIQQIKRATFGACLLGVILLGAYGLNWVRFRRVDSFRSSLVADHVLRCDTDQCIGSRFKGTECRNLLQRHLKQKGPAKEVIRQRGTYNLLGGFSVTYQVSRGSEEEVWVFEGTHETITSCSVIPRKP